MEIEVEVIVFLKQASSGHKRDYSFRHLGSGFSTYPWWLSLDYNYERLCAHPQNVSGMGAGYRKICKVQYEDTCPLDSLKLVCGYSLCIAPSLGYNISSVPTLTLSLSTHSVEADGWPPTARFYLRFLLVKRSFSSPLSPGAC